MPAQVMQFRHKDEVRREAEQMTPAQEASSLRLHTSFLLGLQNRTIAPGLRYLTLDELRAAARLAHTDKYGVFCMIREARERWYRQQSGIVQLSGFDLLTRSMSDSQEA